MPDIISDPFIALLGALAIVVIVAIYYIFGRKPSEDETGKSPDAVRMQVNRAMEALATAYRQLEAGKVKYER